MAQQMQAALENLSDSQIIADSNLTASLDFPFMMVIDFHVSQLAQETARRQSKRDAKQLRVVA